MLALKSLISKVQSVEPQRLGIDCIDSGERWISLGSKNRKDSYGGGRGQEEDDQMEQGREEEVEGRKAEIKGHLWVLFKSETVGPS